MMCRGICGDVRAIDRDRGVMFLAGTFQRRWPVGSDMTRALPRFTRYSPSSDITVGGVWHARD